MDGSCSHMWWKYYAWTQIKQVVSTKSLYLIFWYIWGIPNSHLQQNLKKMIVLALNMFIIGSCGQGLDDLNQIMIFLDFLFCIQHMILPKKIIVIWFFSLELIATNYEEEKEEFSYKAGNCNWSISLLKMNICSPLSERTAQLFRIWKTSFLRSKQEMSE